MTGERLREIAENSDDAEKRELVEKVRVLQNTLEHRALDRMFSLPETFRIYREPISDPSEEWRCSFDCQDYWTGACAAEAFLKALAAAGEMYQEEMSDVLWKAKVTT